MQRLNITKEDAEAIVLNIKSGQLMFAQIKTYVLDRIIELLDDPSLSLIAQQAIEQKKRILEMEMQEKLSFGNITNL